MTFISKLTRVKCGRKFLTVFSIFWVDLLQNVRKPPNLNKEFISKLTQNFWLFLNLLSRFASNCWKTPYLNKEFISKLTYAKRERKFLTVFSIFWVDLFQNVRKPPIQIKNLSSSWPAWSAKENFWLFFQSF